MAWYDDLFAGLNDVVSGVGSFASNTLDASTGIFTSIDKFAQSIINSETVKTQQQVPVNQQNGMQGYFTTDNLIMAGGVVLFGVAIWKLLK